MPRMGAPTNPVSEPHTVHIKLLECPFFLYLIEAHCFKISLHSINAVRIIFLSQVV